MYHNESLTHIIHQKTNEVFSKIPTKILEENNLISVNELKTTSINSKILENDKKSLKQDNENKFNELNYHNNNTKYKTDANIRNLNETKIPNTKHISRSQTRKFINSPKQTQSNNKITTNKLNYNSLPIKKNNDEQVIN